MTRAGMGRCHSPPASTRRNITIEKFYPDDKDNGVILEQFLRSCPQL